MMQHLEFVQRESEKNMAFHMENMECLQRESNNTLTFLYVAVSASFSGALKIYAVNGFGVLSASLSFLCIYLTATSVYLVLACLKVRIVKAPANEPKNLKERVGYTSESLQGFELEKLQERIDFNRIRNEKTGFHLNAVRFLICFSPLVFFVFTVFFWILRNLFRCG